MLVLITGVGLASAVHGGWVTPTVNETVYTGYAILFEYTGVPGRLGVGQFPIEVANTTLELYDEGDTMLLESVPLWYTYNPGNDTYNFTENDDEMKYYPEPIEDPDADQLSFSVYYDPGDGIFQRDGHGRPVSLESL